MAHGQSWHTCDSKIKQTVKDIDRVSHERFGENLVAVILNGSLAMGIYYFPKSDLDMLVVVEKPIEPRVRRDYFLSIEKISRDRPSVGDIELTVVCRGALSSRDASIPLEVHFSEDAKKRFSDIDFSKQSFDADLSAHFMVAYHRGVTISGKKFSDLAGEPSWESYPQAIKSDLEWILQSDNILSSPFYSILNCCRAYRLLVNDEKTVLSKEDGGLWALDHLEQVLQRQELIFDVHQKLVRPFNRRPTES